MSKKEREIWEFEMDFKKYFCYCSYLVYLSNDDIISSRTGLKTGVKNDISWSEIGSGFWRTGRHAPTKNSHEYPPPPTPTSSPRHRFVSFGFVIFSWPLFGLVRLSLTWLSFNSVYHSRLVRCSEDLQGFNERVTLHAQTIVLQYYLPEIVYRVFL